LAKFHANNGKSTRLVFHGGGGEGKSQPAVSALGKRERITNSFPSWAKESLERERSCLPTKRASRERGEKKALAGSSPDVVPREKKKKRIISPVLTR